MRKIVPLLLLLAICTCSCTTLNNWLFDASDYKLIQPRKDVVKDEQDNDEMKEIFWNDVDFEIWLEEEEYE